MKVRKMLELLWLLCMFFLYPIESQCDNKTLLSFLDTIAHDNYTKSPSVTVIKKIKTKKSILFLLQDSTGSLYILKQIKNKNVCKQLTLILDEIASSVAKFANIPVSYTRIIPLGICLIEEQYVDRIALLSTFVPGGRIYKVKKKRFFKEKKSAFKNKKRSKKTHSRFDLKQQRSSRGIKIFKGLPRSVISTIRRHADLSKIVALDIFVGNNDRGKPNVLYDKGGDKYYGIDLEYAWSEGLTEDDFDRLEQRILKRNLSIRELKGLKCLKQYLQVLVAKYSPELLYNQLDKLIDFSGLMRCEDAKVVVTLGLLIQEKKQYITMAYNYANRVITLLDNVLP